MKILFTADWHVKLGQKNVNKEWALNRYHSFFDSIRSFADKVDLHIIGGDLFDKLPSMEELSLYFEFIANPGPETLIFTGNHEATKKGKTFMTYLKEATNRISNGKVSVVDTSVVIGDVQILDYTDLHKAEAVLDTFDRNKAVFTHVRGAIEPHVIPEIDLSVFDKFPVVFSGDLHSFQNCQRNIKYPGSPMTTSFHRERTKNTNGYFIIDTTDWSSIWAEFNLPQLIRKTITNPVDAIPTSPDLTIYELEGDLKNISQVKSDLIASKKITSEIATDSIITGLMSEEEELAAYLDKVLKLADTEKVLKYYHDYVKNA